MKQEWLDLEEKILRISKHPSPVATEAPMMEIDPGTVFCLIAEIRRLEEENNDLTTLNDKRERAGRI